MSERVAMKFTLDFTAFNAAIRSAARAMVEFANAYRRAARREGHKHITDPKIRTLMLRRDRRTARRNRRAA